MSEFIRDFKIDLSVSVKKAFDFSNSKSLIIAEAEYSGQRDFAYLKSFAFCFIVALAKKISNGFPRS